MMLEALRKEVWRANKLLPELGLVTFTWGNVSGIDRERGLVCIKPSGVEYDLLTPESMVITDLDGHVVEGDLTPPRIWRPIWSYIRHSPRWEGLPIHIHPGQPRGPRQGGTSPLTEPPTAIISTVPFPAPAP